MLNAVGFDNLWRAAAQSGAPLVHERFGSNLVFEIERGNREKTEAALTGLAASCGSILAAHFPPGPPVDPARQRFHIV